MFFKSHHRLLAAAGTLGALGLLSGCGLATGSHSISAQAPAAPTTTESPYLPTPSIFKLGNFDEHDPEFDFFDPCWEVPVEIREEVGMVEEVSSPFFDYEFGQLGKINECIWADQKAGQGFYLGFQSDVIYPEHLPHLGEIIDSSPDSRIEGLQIHTVNGAKRNRCMTSIYTDHGRWGVIASSADILVPREENCARAIAVHEKIYESLGENNGITH